MGTGIVAGLLTLSALQGCASGASQDGSITGSAQPCVGVVPVSSPLPAIPLVQVVGRARTVAASRMRLAAPYRFTFKVLPGHYAVEASPDQPVEVTVTRNHTAHVSLFSGCK